MLTMGGEGAIQYTDDVLWSCVHKTCIILLTDATTINQLNFCKFSQTSAVGFYTQESQSQHFKHRTDVTTHFLRKGDLTIKHRQQS